MEKRISAYRGCMLGLAAGDALGYTVDRKSLAQIHLDYGPNGLLGYDLANGYADISSYTQLAAYSANGLLIGATQSRSKGATLQPLGFLALAEREWNRIQRERKLPQRTSCWVSHVEEFRRRVCMDTRMRDMLNRETLGTLQAPVNPSTSAGALTVAVPIGLFYDPERMDARALCVLGAQAVALTHGDPEAFLTGAAVACLIAGIVDAPELSLREHFLHAADIVAQTFGEDYPQAFRLRECIDKIELMVKNRILPPEQAMEKINCSTSFTVFAGVVYACLQSGGSFDDAFAIAVNHSGASAAVGALTGAVMGASLGEEPLLGFYLDGLQSVEPLRTLADDLVRCRRMGRTARLFDDDWDRKYVQGEPVEAGIWEEA